MCHSIFLYVLILRGPKLEGAEWEVPHNFSAIVSFEATYMDWIVK
jgi:hypothetical protein